MDQQAIAGFWSWFAASAELLARNLEDATLLAELDRRVSSLGAFAWEIGPGEEREFSLTISPSGKKELALLAEQVVAACPELDLWEMRAYKPPKKWDLRFSLDDAGDRLIDANQWEYVIFRFPDGKIDIVVHAPDVSDLSEDMQQRAAEIAVEGQIGERALMDTVNVIEVVCSLDADLEEKKTSFEHLPAHFKRLEQSLP